jgi:hypothetical protein
MGSFFQRADVQMWGCDGGQVCIFTSRTTVTKRPVRLSLHRAQRSPNDLCPYYRNGKAAVRVSDEIQEL